MAWYEVMPQIGVRTHQLQPGLVVQYADVAVAEPTGLYLYDHHVRLRHRVRLLHQDQGLVSLYKFPSDHVLTSLSFEAVRTITPAL